MRFDQFYATTTPTVQPAAPQSPAQNTAQQTPRVVPTFGAQAWIGVVIVLVALRFLYEYSE